MQGPGYSDRMTAGLNTYKRWLTYLTAIGPAYVLWTVGCNFDLSMTVWCNVTDLLMSINPNTCKRPSHVCWLGRNNLLLKDLTAILHSYITQKTDQMSQHIQWGHFKWIWITSFLSPKTRIKLTALFGVQMVLWHIPIPDTLCYVVMLCYMHL